MLIDDRNITEVAGMSIDDSYQFFDKTPRKWTEKKRDIGELPLKEIKNRLKFMIDVGLDYRPSTAGPGLGQAAKPSDTPGFADRLETGRRAVRARMSRP